jgi:hypothetical protein
MKITSKNYKTEREENKEIVMNCEISLRIEVTQYKGK